MMKQYGEAVAAFKGMLERQENEIKTIGTASGETKAAIDKIQDQLNVLETKMNRAPLPGDGKNADPEAMQKKNAFTTYCRKGAQILKPEELKYLFSSDDTTGGYLMVPQMVNEIIKNVIEISPIRNVARVITTSKQSVKIPKRTGVFTAKWINDRSTKAETDGLRFGLEEIPAHELYALVGIHLDNLDDSEFNLESELNSEFSEQFGVAEGKAFVTGDGVGKPEGILTNKDVLSTNSGDATKITADSLISLYYDIKTEYARNGAWGLNRLAMKQIRQLKDGQGNYLWNPGLAAGQAPTILERPYIEIADMPDPEAGTFPVVFGDMRRAYYIVDRLQISVQRDPYTLSDQGIVKFTARKRTGGQIVLPEAIRKLKIGL